ncbi:MAG: SRPBCC family protein [Pseudomonadota bacterium]
MSTGSAVSLFAPVTKTLHLKVSPSQAFGRFAERFGEWWPRHAGHSVFGPTSTGCLMEAGVGGRILEQGEGGAVAEWGRVTAWEPPRRLQFSWYPGRDAATAQRVEVTFTADAEGTLIELAHHDWHLLGEQAEAVRDGYDSGWDTVLGTFGAHATRAARSTLDARDLRGWVAAFRTTIDVPRDRLWHLLTTADGLNQWFTDATTLEPQAGGQLVFRWRNLAADGSTLEHFGRVCRYEPVTCFEFDWQADSGTYDLRCRIDFEETGRGTLVSLTESGFQETPTGLQDLLNRQGGWAQVLTQLKAFAQHGIRL